MVQYQCNIGDNCSLTLIFQPIHVSHFNIYEELIISDQISKLKLLQQRSETLSLEYLFNIQYIKMQRSHEDMLRYF